MTIHKSGYGRSFSLEFMFCKATIKRLIFVYSILAVILTCICFLLNLGGGFRHFENSTGVSAALPFSLLSLAAGGATVFPAFHLAFLSIKGPVLSVSQKGILLAPKRNSTTIPWRLIEVSRITSNTIEIRYLYPEAEMKTGQSRRRRRFTFARRLFGGSFDELIQIFDAFAEDPPPLTDFNLFALYDKRTISDDSLLSSLRSETQPSLRLLLSEHGSTKTCWFGGLPFTASPFEWPLHESTGEPLAFLAQIAFSALPASHAIEHLPTTGILLFFSKLDFNLFDSADSSFAKVIYFEDEKQTQEANAPKGVIQFRKRYLEIASRSSQPQMSGGSESEDDRRRDELWRDLERQADIAAFGRHLKGHPHHQIGGHPWWSQSSPEILQEHILLLQLAVDSSIGFDWEGGVLHFLISKPDAREKKFERAFMNADFD